MTVSFNLAIAKLPDHLAKDTLVTALINEHTELVQRLKRISKDYPLTFILNPLTVNKALWLPKEFRSGLSDLQALTVPNRLGEKILRNKHYHILNRVHTIEKQITDLALRCLSENCLSNLFPVTPQP